MLGRFVKATFREDTPFRAVAVALAVALAVTKHDEDHFHKQKSRSYSKFSPFLQGFPRAAVACLGATINHGRRIPDYDTLLEERWKPVV